jgi:hypothetical protein
MPGAVSVNRKFKNPTLAKTARMGHPAKNPLPLRFNRREILRFAQNDNNSEADKQQRLEKREGRNQGLS